MAETDPLQIIALQTENFKALRFFAVEFPPDGGAFVIGGPNRVGKTSTIDALRALLLGDKYRPSNPTRDGSAVAAHVQALFGDGTKVERGGKNFSLKVTAPGDPNARQGLLDKRFARLAIDPTPLLKGNGKARVEALLQSLPGVGKKLAELDQQHDELFSQRTTAGTLAKAAETQLAALEYHPDAPDEEVSVGELSAKIGVIERRQEEVADARQVLSEMERFEDAPDEEVSVVSLAQVIADAKESNQKKVDADRAITHSGEEVDRMNREIAALQEKIAAHELAMKVNGEILGPIIDFGPIQARLNRAESDNARFIANREHDKRQAVVETAKLALEKALGEHGDLPTVADAEENNAKFRANAARKKQEDDATAKRSEHTRLDDCVTRTRNARQALLEGADMPLAGLGIEAGELTFKGQSWDGVAGSDRLKIVIQICRKQKPDCRFVVGGGCEEMDVDTLREFSDTCKASKPPLLAIFTRVSVGDECDEIIEGGGNV